MNVEYWNKEKEQWLPARALDWSEYQRINEVVGWEMYRKAE